MYNIKNEYKEKRLEGTVDVIEELKKKIDNIEMEVNKLKEAKING